MHEIQMKIQKNSWLHCANVKSIHLRSPAAYGHHQMIIGLLRHVTLEIRTIFFLKDTR